MYLNSSYFRTIERSEDFKQLPLQIKMSAVAKLAKCDVKYSICYTEIITIESHYIIRAALAEVD